MFSLAYNLPKMTSNSWKFRRKKYVQTKWIFWPSKSSWTNKCVDRNAVDILTREITYKKYVVARWFFNHKNYIEKSMWKKRGFFKHRNYIEKNTWKQRGFFDHQSYIEKCTWKRRGNSSKFGLRRVDVISASNPRWFDMECPLGMCSIEKAVLEKFGTFTEKYLCWRYEALQHY